MLGYYSFAKDINNTNELINKIEQQNGLNKILWCEKEWEMIPSKQECPNGGTITIGYTMNHYDCNSGCLISSEYCPTGNICPPTELIFDDF